MEAFGASPATIRRRARDSFGAGGRGAGGRGAGGTPLIEAPWASPSPAPEANCLPPPSSLRTCSAGVSIHPGAQPRFWREGNRNLGSSTKSGSGVLAPEKCLKRYMRFGALYYICCTKIINFANFKVTFFSAFIRKIIFATVKKTCWKLKLLLL